MGVDKVGQKKRCQRGYKKMEGPERRVDCLCVVMVVTEKQ